jgi:hypothetical protein
MASLLRLEKLMESVPWGTGLPSLNLPVMMVDKVMQAEGTPVTRIAGKQHH